MAGDRDELDPPPGAGPVRSWLPVVVAVARRPGLWLTAVAQVGRLARPGWWRHRPFLPLPDPAYLSFRLETAYGDGRRPAPADVVAYLHWCREFPHPGP